MLSLHISWPASICLVYTCPANAMLNPRCIGWQQSHIKEGYLQRSSQRVHVLANGTDACTHLQVLPIKIPAMSIHALCSQLIPGTACIHHCLQPLLQDHHLIMQSPCSWPITCSCVQVGLRYNLPVRSPLDDGGIFTAQAGAPFEGKSVLGDGNTAVVSALQDAGALLKVGLGLGFVTRICLCCAQCCMCCTINQADHRDD